MSRTAVAASRLAFGAALAATLVAPASQASPAWAAPPRVPRPELVTRERLHQTISYRARGPAAGVAIRETRRLRAGVNILLPNFDPATVTANTYVGLRIGDFAFQRPVSFDPSWRPGRTRATFRVASLDGDRRGITVVRARWGSGTLRMWVASTSAAPVAAANVSAAAGPVTSAIDGAARLGAEHVHLGGTAHGVMTRTVLPILDTTADLADLVLDGRGDVVPDSADTAPPVVTITRPAPVSTVTAGSLRVEGAVRDDRTVASLTWSVDDGPATDATFDADPATGFLDDLRGTFSFSAPVTEGLHSLRVVARDAAGNEGSAKIDFAVTASGRSLATLRTSKWGAVCLDPKGRVQSWGYGTTAPTIVPDISDAQTALGNLALLADGTVTTLRGDPSGATYTTAPVAVEGLTDVVALTQSSTSPNSCALRSDGTVWAWGDNSSAQLGDGTTTARYPPVQVTGLPKIVAISEGAYHVLALDDQGAVWTWGGSDAATNVAVRSPQQVAGVSDATQISASQFDRYQTGAAIRSDGTLWMWGDATSGQLGSSVTDRHTPAFEVEGVSDVQAVAMGYNHVLVLLGDGTVVARGGPTPQVSGYWGELGDGTSTPNLEFQPVPGLSGVTQVSAGAHTSHALLADGTIRAWGQNTYGSLGDGTKVDRWSPVVVQLSQ